MTDYEQLMEEHRRINAEWMDALSGLNDMARGAIKPGIWARSERIGRRFSEPIVMVPGNAKARRRWRRRNLPNTQREAAKARAVWIAGLDAKAEHFGTASWVPGIWKGVPK